jgi:hypothetical protein
MPAAPGETPRIELLVLDGCPNSTRAQELVERVNRSLGLESPIDVVVIPNVAAARKHRFLGSPTIRVDGHDIDPHADGRMDYGLSCRVYETRSGLARLPEEAWLLGALNRSGPA